MVSRFLRSSTQQFWVVCPGDCRRQISAGLHPSVGRYDNDVAAGHRPKLWISSTWRAAGTQSDEQKMSSSRPSSLSVCRAHLLLVLTSRDEGTECCVCIYLFWLRNVIFNKFNIEFLKDLFLNFSAPQWVRSKVELLRESYRERESTVYVAILHCKRVRVPTSILRTSNVHA